jgi:hypothetical protein
MAMIRNPRKYPIFLLVISAVWSIPVKCFVQSVNVSFIVPRNAKRNIGRLLADIK